MLQPDDGLSEMSMEEDLNALKSTKKEEPENLALKIAKISMRYKVKLPDNKKEAHITRLEKVPYADVLTAKESDRKKLPVAKVTSNLTTVRNC